MMTTKDAFIANVFEVFFDIQFLFEVPAGAQCFVMRLNQSTKVLANTLLEKDELENLVDYIPKLMQLDIGRIWRSKI